MKWLLFYGYTCAALLLFNTGYAQYNMKHFIPLHGLRGTWKMETKKGFLYEQWYTVNDSLLQNKGYRVNGSDTLPQETVQLKISGGAITYTSTVANQNNQQPVTFTLVKNDNGKYIFENTAHDFPQQISYELKDANTLDAVISGRINDKYREISFYFTRDK